jgi:hypothetical protein
MYAKRLVHTAVLTMVLGLALGGCRYYWFKPGITTEAFGSDSEACLQEARSVSSVQKYGVVNEQVRHIYRACLTSRGYQRQKTTDGPDKYRGYEFDD